MKGARPFPTRPLSRRGIQALRRPHVPANALCPTCGFLQTLDAGKLGSIDPQSPLPDVEIDWPPRWAGWTLEDRLEDWDLGVEPDQRNADLAIDP